jgi:molecular chaperone DnaJ
MDLYALLGVRPGASSTEIERAYRRLARRYHPDINPGDQVAADLYRQVHEAYRVLGDHESRRRYDLGASPVLRTETAVSFEGFDFSALADGPVAATFTELFAGVFQAAARDAALPADGADIEAAVDVSFGEAASGATVAVSVARSARCAPCAGTGRVSRAPIVCGACGGVGSRRSVRGHMVFTTSCDECGGSGRLVSDACRVCAGAGVVPTAAVVSLTLPAGVEPDTRLAVPGAGHAGTRGGQAGDLYVTVAVRPHPVLRRAGRDLLLSVPLALHEAALGAKIEVPTLDGRARLRVPPGTGSGQRLRVPGRGLPAGPGGDPPAGDLLVDVEIVVPDVLDERSKALLREFGALNTLDVRRNLFSGEAAATDNSAVS